MRKPKPLKGYRKPDIPTLCDLLEDPDRRRFLELAGAGAVVLAGGGLLVACEDEHLSDDDSGAPAYDDCGGVECRLPRTGTHGLFLGDGARYEYAVYVCVTDASTAAYLEGNKVQALEALDRIVYSMNCHQLDAYEHRVEDDMAVALDEHVRASGGAGNVLWVWLVVESCG